MEKIRKSDEEWKKQLSPVQYKALRQKGTEAPFSGKYWDVFENGVYVCAGCGNKLFSAGAKYDSGTGWPTFYNSIANGGIELVDNPNSEEAPAEVICSRCGGHLGYAYEDGPPPTNKRYSINSTALELKKD